MELFELLCVIAAILVLQTLLQLEFQEHFKLIVSMKVHLSVFTIFTKPCHCHFVPLNAHVDDKGIVAQHELRMIVEDRQGQPLDCHGGTGGLRPQPLVDAG